MQTFLPYEDFRESAKCLDRLRLGKQRLEAKMLLQGKWPNHPASKMWRGYELCLAIYLSEICYEWIRRGYEDNILAWLKVWLMENYGLTLRDLANNPPAKPPWLGNELFHLAHMSNLVRKDPVHYTFDVPNDLAYCWPGRQLT